MKRKELISQFGLPLVVAALAFGGCGGANPARPEVAHGTLDLSQKLPAPTPTPYPTFGAGQRAERDDVSRDAQAAIAPYLKGQRSRVARAPVESLAAEPTHALAAPAAPAVATDAAPADDAPLIASKPEPLTLDTERYAQRQSQKAEAYRGGDVIVIGAGTLVLVLIVVLLVILLT